MLPLKKRGEFDPSIEAIIDCVCYTNSSIGKVPCCGDPGMSIDKVDNHFVCDLTAATRHCCTVNHFSDCKRHRIFDQFRALQPSDVLDPEGELLKRIILRERTPLS